MVASIVNEPPKRVEHPAAAATKISRLCFFSNGRTPNGAEEAVE